MLTVTTRPPGTGRALVPDFQMPLPPELAGGDGAVRLRDLIAAVVRWELIEQAASAEGGRFHRALAAHEIADGAAQGRIVPATRRPGKPVDAEQAIGTAWQAFEDGLYLVFVDGQVQRGLDDAVTVGVDSTVAFVRLMMLRAGGRW